MASPHVAGVAALYLQDGTPPADVWTEMADRATRDKISDAGAGSPNLLLYSGMESGDPCNVTACTTVFVQWIDAVSKKVNKRNVASGTVTVQIADASGPAPDVTVTGSWTVNGNDNFTTSSGVTDALGKVTLSTGGIRFAEDFEFCVDDLSKFGTRHGSLTECSPHGAELGGGGGGGGGGGEAGAPDGLTTEVVQRGPNTRVELNWTGGGAAVNIVRDDAVIAANVSNSGAYTDNWGKNATPGDYSYVVCNAGTEDCTGESTAIIP